MTFLRVEHKERRIKREEERQLLAPENFEGGRKNKSSFYITSTYGETMSDKLGRVKWIE
jgi:hypothetical protein